MRAILAVVSVAAVAFAMSPAQAEKRLFIIANNADGYGVDRCLASGAPCGTAAATAYCTSHELNKALLDLEILGMITVRWVAKEKRRIEFVEAAPPPVRYAE